MENYISNHDTTCGFSWKFLVVCQFDLLMKIDYFFTDNPKEYKKAVGAWKLKSLKK